LDLIPKGGYKLPISDKKLILTKLKVGVVDIIKKYRRAFKTTKDSDIVPIEYTDIYNIISNTEITELFFVYKNAAKWFLHSIVDKKPVPLTKLHYKIPTEEVFYKFTLNDRIITARALPPPLNRFTKKEDMISKYIIYKRFLG